MMSYFSRWWSASWRQEAYAGGSYQLQYTRQDCMGPSICWLTTWILFDLLAELLACGHLRLFFGFYGAPLLERHRKKSIGHDSTHASFAYV